VATYGFDEQAIKNWWQRAGEYCQNAWHLDGVKEEAVTLKYYITGSIDNSTQNPKSQPEVLCGKIQNPKITF